MLANIVINLP